MEIQNSYVGEAFKLLQKNYLMSEAEMLLINGVDPDIEYRVARTLGEKIKVTGGIFCTPPETKPNRVDVGLKFVPGKVFSSESNVLEYLDILSKLSGDQFEQEIVSPMFLVMSPRIKKLLWVDGRINSAFADQVDKKGLAVAYHPGEHTHPNNPEVMAIGRLFIEFPSGKLSWSII